MFYILVARDVAEGGGYTDVSYVGPFLTHSLATDYYTHMMPALPGRGISGVAAFEQAPQPLQAPDDAVMSSQASTGGITMEKADGVMPENPISATKVTLNSWSEYYADADDILGAVAKRGHKHAGAARDIVASMLRRIALRAAAKSVDDEKRDAVMAGTMTINEAIAAGDPFRKSVAFLLHRLNADVEALNAVMSDPHGIVRQHKELRTAVRYFLASVAEYMHGPGMSAEIENLRKRFGE